MTPEELLAIYDELRTCEDGEYLQRSRGIFDNFPVHIFGDKLSLFRQLYLAFLNSPSEAGLNYRWLSRQTPETTRLKLKGLDMGQIYGSPSFDFEPGTAVVLFHAYSSVSYEDFEGKPYAFNLTFHPENAKKGQEVNPRVALARGIADFVQYVARNDITARFPRFEGPYC